MSFECAAHLGKSYINAAQYGRVFSKTKKSELKSVGNFVAMVVLVQSANPFSLEEVCRTQYSLKYFRSHIDHQTLWKEKNLKEIQRNYETLKMFVFALNVTYSIVVERTIIYIRVWTFPKALKSDYRSSGDFMTITCSIVLSCHIVPNLIHSVSRGTHILIGPSLVWWLL